MATRPTQQLQNALIMTFTVEAGGAATKGRRAKFGAGDGLMTNAGAGEASIGTFMETATAGNRVQVLLDGHAIVAVKVGTGGATRGLHAVPVADGLADQAVGGGTTLRNVTGKFMQSGVLNDEVGLLIGCPVSTVSS